ncbi:alanine/glycine:cation symporter family protein [Floccifex sp.]|uniref:alanine/glycine:cation symporter family protein n=1 Tax=Floccifex sp. TaxID=2815810 RepID=UPI003F043256
METFTYFLNQIKELIWGYPLIFLLLGTGLYFSIQLGFLQFRKLFLAFRLLFKKEDQPGDVSSFQALCTALSSTIGTGNIVGVATAIMAGGPGAIFWMWVSAFLGMATKYAEGLLAIEYRIKDAKGQMAGGPMYYIERGLHLKWLAKCFAFFGLCVALLGIGTFTQVKSISDALSLTFHIPTLIVAVLLVICVGFITLGGIQRIASVSEKIVPFMSVAYISGVICILCLHFKQIPSVFHLIFQSAFSYNSVFGATLGIAMKSGISRGIFSNESGLGSAPIAAASAKTHSSVEQGLVSMTGTFIDTILVCTMTGLAILITQAYNTNLNGAALTTYAFTNTLGSIGSYIVNIGLIFFAFTTIIGWNFYGEKCIQYLWGEKSILPYKIVFLICIAIGPFMSLEFVFVLADIVNGCMAFPNLIGLIGLRNVIISKTKEYFKRA